MQTSASPTPAPRRCCAQLLPDYSGSAGHPRHGCCGSANRAGMSGYRRTYIVSARIAYVMLMAFGPPLPAFSAEDPAAKSPTVEGIIIGTYQATRPRTIDGETVENEASAAIDVNVSVPIGRGSFQFEAKGGTTPQDEGVTTFLPEANATVGETLDSDGEGRIVVWQMFYQHDIGPGSLAGGLVDPTAGRLDTNDIANDEFTQFLATSFVNNPTIDFPSATLGVAYDARLSERMKLVAMATNAIGIEPEYSSAFEFGDGVFGALELQWQRGAIAGNVGIWANTNDQQEGRLKEETASGLYGNLSGSVGKGQWNLRLGWADPSVQAAAAFVSFVYAHQLGEKVLGAGIAETFASGDIPEPHGDTVQAELYMRIPLGKGFTVTPDLQYIVHSDFNPEQDGNWVIGLRAGWSF